MMKILIAEDKPESLALLDSFLKKRNYQTYCAPNGKVALEILEKNKIDLIISDILMPEVDGYILCQKVKSNPRWSQIPFIFYTATFTSRQDEIFAIKLGAARFVRKPINPTEFGKIILDVLQKYKKGTLESAQYKFKEEKDVFRLYNLRVIEKLEQKVSELEESENRYRILFETAAEGILIINSSTSQFKYANPAICLMLGYTEEELLKLGIADIHPKDKLPEIRREFEALNHGQKSLAMDIPCQRKDGSILYANFSINQITMGGVKYSVAFVTDTTEYKKAMDALRLSEARLSTATKIAKLGYWEIDNSDNLFTFDDNFYAIFHTTAAKEGGYKMSPAQYAKRFLHPDDQQMIAIEMQKSLQATDPHYHRQLEHRIIYADGGTGWIAVNFFIKKDDQGRTIGAFGINQDITERKQMQEMIVQEQKELKLIIDTSPVIIFYKDKEGKFIRVNKAFADALQMNEADFIGKTVFDLYTKKIAQSMTDDDRKVFKSNRPKLNIIEQYQSAGSLKWVQTDKIPIQDENGNPIGLIGFALDITERKQAEEALRKSENMLKLISENSRDIICLHDKSHKYLYVSPICKTLLGYKPEELIGTNPWELVHPEDLEFLQKEGPEKAETEGISLLSYRIRKKSGKYIWFESASQTLRDDKGKITGYVTSSRDITERKRVEEALIAERDKLQRVTDGLTAVEIGIDIVDINYRVLYQNLFLKNRFGDLTNKLCYEKYMNLKEPCPFCPMVKAIATNLPQKLELTGADGKIYELLSAPLPDPDGTVNKVIEIVRDITERKQAEEEYKQLINNMSETVWVINFEGKFVEVNDAAVKQLGYSREELLTMGPKDIDPNLSTVEIDQLIKGMKSDAIQNFETAHRTKAGKIIPVEINSTPVTYHGQRAILSIARDITERKQAEENIRRITESTHAILWHADVTKMKNESQGCRGFEWDTHYLNLENLSNFIPLKEAPDIDLGQRYHTSILEEDRLRMDEISAKAFKDNAESYEQEYRLQDADGTLHWMREHVDINKINASHFKVTGIIIEISELKRVQEALDLAVQSARVGLWNQDFRTGKITRNAEWANMLGYELSEIESDVNFFYKLIHPDDWQRVEKSFKDHESGKSKFLQTEHRMRTKDGNWKWILNMGRVIEWDATGKPLRAAGVHLDITERKQAEETLRESEERYRLITDNSLDAILLTDPNGLILAANKAACAMLQMTEKEICAADRRGVVDTKDPRLAELLEKRQRDGFARGEITMIRKDGSKFPADVSSAIFYNSKGELRTSMIIRDESERKQIEAEKRALETQLLQSQKMEAIGTLAGGIAHDFNNLLTIIQGHAQLMMAAKNEGDQEYYSLKQIVNAAFRAAQLTRQLLLFSRKQEMSFAILNPNQTIDNISKMLERLIGENIVIKLQLGDNLWNIEADEGNLEQVIMNLVVNARDAMPHGGTLTVKTENLELTEQDCALIPRSSPGKYICLTIQDTGCGIPPEVIDKIFDPFFTTKEAGKGTGLGLSVAYGIIKKHNGWINVKSEPGKGTIFTICLPASQKSVLDDLTLKDQLAQKFGQGEPILVIEDDNDVRKFMVTILQHYHYVPLEAADAATASTIFQKEKEKIKLIIADVILPDRNGILLVEDFLATQAHIPVIMCSGYANEKIQHEIIKKRKFHYLQKPIKAQTFLDLVQDTLESARK